MKKAQNTGFICINCKKIVEPIQNGVGGYRNHCPFCLCSIHVDQQLGDRRSDCFGLMRPVAVAYNSQKGYQIQHKCDKCGKISLNILTDDVTQPDNMSIIYDLMKNA